MTPVNQNLLVPDRYSAIFCNNLCNMRVSFPLHTVALANTLWLYLLKMTIIKSSSLPIHLNYYR